MDHLEQRESAETAPDKAFLELIHAVVGVTRASMGLGVRKTGFQSWSRCFLAS